MALITAGDKSQNSSVIPIGYVGANDVSKSQLSAGSYSLSRRANVPFVTLVGSAGFSKTLTWGESGVVPKNETVTVKNSSYHGGDIWLNKDVDPCNRPSRISVPVKYQVVQVPGIAPAQYVWQADFPCDVRAAKRAYWNADALVQVAQVSGIDLYVRGRRLDGSMNTDNYLGFYTAPYGPGVGFLNYHNVPPSTEVSYIPLGQGAPPGDDTRPHMLLDAHDVFMNMGASNTIDDFVLSPASANQLPPPTSPFILYETFYVIEYD